MAASLDKGTGALRKGEELLLSYTIKSTGNNPDLKTQITSKGGTFNLLSELNYASPTTQRVRKEEFFQLDKSASNGDLKFILAETNQTVHLDNISLRKVSTQPVNHDNLVRFFANTSGQKKSFSVPSGQWQSVRGKAYSGSVTLAPYSSIILVRTDGKASPTPVADNPPKPTPTSGAIAAGVYEFKPISAKTRVMEVYQAKKYSGANVSQNNDRDANYHRWKVTPTGDGYYRISPLHAPQLALEMRLSDRYGKTPNAHVKPYTGGNNQKWKAIPVEGKRYYYFAPKSNGPINRDLQLAVASTNQGSNINIVLAKRSSASTQQWYLARISDKNARTAEDPDKPVLLEDELDTSFEVYPNPLSSGDLTVALDPEAEASEVQVLDVSGRLILETTSLGQASIAFSKEELGSGVRVIKVVSDGRTMVERIVVE